MLARARRPAVIAVAVAASSACFQYVPSTGAGAPAPGTEVRLLLTDLAAAQLAGLLGAGVTALDGRIDQAGGDSVVVRATGTVLRNGDVREWANERIAVPATAVASVQTRRLSRGRTALAVLSGVGLVIAAIVTGSAFTSGDGMPSGPPPVGQ